MLDASVWSNIDGDVMQHQVTSSHVILLTNRFEPNQVFFAFVAGVSGLSIGDDKIHLNFCCIVATFTTNGDLAISKSTFVVHAV